jgi:BON domain
VPAQELLDSANGKKNRILNEKSVIVTGVCAFAALVVVSVLSRFATEAYLASKNGVVAPSKPVGAPLARGDIIAPVALRMKLAGSQVTLLGNVPNESARLTLLERAQKAYGPDNVVDRLNIQTSVATTPWFDSVAKWFPPALKSIKSGEITVSGTNVLLLGDAENHSARVAAGKALAAAAGSDVVVQNELKIATESAVFNGAALQTGAAQQRRGTVNTR